MYNTNFHYNKKSKRSSLLTIGSFLAIFAGLLRILDGILLLTLGKTLYQFMNLQDSETTALTISNNNLISGIIALAIALLALVGGFSALRRKQFMLALILGGIVAFIADPFFVFGLLAFVLIAFSRKDFE